MTGEYLPPSNEGKVSVESLQKGTDGMKIFYKGKEIGYFDNIQNTYENEFYVRKCVGVIRHVENTLWTQDMSYIQKLTELSRYIEKTYTYYQYDCASGSSVVLFAAWYLGGLQSYKEKDPGTAHVWTYAVSPDGSQSWRIDTQGRAGE